MIYALVALIAWAIFSLYYIRRLKIELHSHEADWKQIEEISDHNQDGDVVIQIQHVPEIKVATEESVAAKHTHQDKDSW
jgi:hypothetical protein